MEDFNLIQESKEENHLFQLNAKHYWVVNDFNHLYPIAGYNYFNTNYSTLDAQRLSDGSFNNFKNTGFNNQINYQLNDTYAGLEYKFKSGRFTGKPAFKIHHYNWNIKQFNTQIADKQKFVFLPAINLDYKEKSGGKYSLIYALKSNFANAQQYANRLRLLSFNRISRGDENLENQLYHQLSLRYSKFRLSKKLTFNTFLSLNIQERSIRHQTKLEGIDQIQELFYTSLPERFLISNTMVSKGWGDWYLNLKLTGIQNNYTRMINDVRTDYTSHNVEYTINTSTQFKDFPNIDIGFSQEFNRLKALDYETNIMQIQPFATLEYDFWEDFLVKFDYRLTYFENQSNHTVNRFDIGNASFEYWNPDKAWRISIEATNIFDTGFKKKSHINEFVITDQRNAIQPRIVLLKLTYKL